MNETYWNICTWLSLGISNTIYDHALDLPYAQEEVKPAPELAEKESRNRIISSDIRS